MMIDESADPERGAAGAPMGGGLNGAELHRREKDELEGTGGSSGGGARAGSGDVSGGTTDREMDRASPAAGDGGDALGKGTLAAGQSSLSSGAEALGAGAGRAAVGSGTPGDKGDLGGGGRGA